MTLKEKKEKKDQFVVAYLCDLDATDGCVAQAQMLAQGLGKGLILLHISDSQYTRIEPEEAEKRLKEINAGVSDQLFHSYLALKGRSRDILHSLGEALNAVAIVAQMRAGEKDVKRPWHPSTLLKNLSLSRTAYMIVGQDFHPTGFDKVVMSVNQLQESKEKTLWASYFGRFFGSEIILYYRDYKDEYHKKQLTLNLNFTRKMFSHFGLTSSEHHSGDNRTPLDVQALGYAKECGCSMIICQTTKNKSFFEYFFGLEEEKVLKNMGSDCAALFLNPRDDLFVMCE